MGSQKILTRVGLGGRRYIPSFEEIREKNNFANAYDFVTKKLANLCASLIKGEMSPDEAKAILLKEAGELAAFIGKENLNKALGAWKLDPLQT
jgi:hypothetical protein